jgi:transposase InsO family protein
LSFPIIVAEFSTLMWLRTLRRFGPPTTSGSLRLYVTFEILLNDRDRIYSLEFQRWAMALGLEEVPIATRSPWQSPYVERLIGSVPHECLDHVIMLKHDHLHRLLESSFAYYHRSRTHLALKDAPRTSLGARPERGKGRCVSRSWATASSLQTQGRLKSLPRQPPPGVLG